MPKTGTKRSASTATASEAATAATAKQANNTKKEPPTIDRYEQIRNKYRNNKSPSKERPAKRQKTAQRSTKHKIYTDTTPDGRDLFIVKNKNGIDPAFTHPINNEMASNPRFKESLSITEWFFRVSDDDPNEILRKPYFNGKGILKHRMQSVYFHKHTGQTSADKRKLWIENAVLPLFNDQGKPDPGKNLFNSMNPQGEQFEYAGDLQELRGSSTNSFVADYITLDNTFNLVIQDWGVEPHGMSVEDIMEHDDLLELYYGPKVQLFKDLYNARQKELNIREWHVETDEDPYKNVPGFHGYDSA